jgi:circadian clock protein KaiC
MTLVQHGVFGNPVDEAAEVSYLADTVVLMRYFEVRGAVRQAISVVKKRSGNHERTIRECRVGKGGLIVGESLTDFHGVLGGIPQFTGPTGDLMRRATDVGSDGKSAAPIRPTAPVKRRKK